jgi:serine/threonine protein kinase
MPPDEKTGSVSRQRLNYALKSLARPNVEELYWHLGTPPEPPLAATNNPTRTVAPADPAATNSLADPVTTTGGEGSSALGNQPSLSTGRYSLGDEIARGGMGVVYRATDTVLGREVAVKVLQDKFGPASAAARRFADEARIAAQLQHPAIPPVHDLGTLPDGRPFLAMKLIKGDSLDDLLDGRPDPTHDRGRFVAAFEQVCQAVAFAHARNVIHRDLKPANVMVGNFAEVQVMDWGLAKVLGARAALPADPDETRGGTEIHSLRDSDGKFTQAGSILGTPGFMPPEQAIGAIDQVDKQSDVFGLGGILCVILTGRAPFIGDSPESTRQAAAKGKVAEAFARLDGCGADPDLVALCKRCLASEKADRPADAGEVAQAVAELRSAADERARRAELERVRLESERTAAEARSAERRKRQRLAGAAVSLLALAVVGGFSAVLLVQRRANTELADKQIKVEKRFELAQKAIAKLHTGVSEDLLLKSDQFKELRTQLLKEAADFYGDLERLLEGESDAKSRRLLAEGYFQLGELTWKIGSKSEALALHRKALTVRRELAAGPEADVETRLDVARSLGAVGRLLRISGDTAGALTALAEQHDMVAALDAEYPTEAVRAVRAQNFIDTGGVLRQMGKSAEALVVTEKALALRRELASANPHDTELQYELANALIYLATALWDLGRGPEDLALNENAQAILQKLADDNPGVARFQHLLGGVHNNIGNHLIDTGKPAEALMAVEKALSVSQKLTATHPAVSNFQHVLALNHLNHGRALAGLGAPAAALVAYQNALTIWQKLAEANPTDIMVPFWLAHCLNDIGELRAQMGAPGAALKFHEEALALLVKPAQANPAFHWVQSVRARVREKTGLLLSASGKPEEALAACEEAVGILVKLRAAQPDVFWARGELADSLNDLGTVQHRAGRVADAVASFRRAIALLEQLATPTPRDLYRLACCHAQLAGLGLTPERDAAEADLAMTVLRQAIATGYGGIAHLRADVYLDALRPREDFQKLLKELEAKVPKTLEVAPPPRAK